MKSIFETGRVEAAVTMSSGYLIIPISNAQQFFG